VAIRITLRIRESKVRNPDPSDYSQTCERILTNFLEGQSMAQGPSDTILVAIRITLWIGSPKSEIWILRIGGGLFSVCAFLFYFICLFTAMKQIAEHLATCLQSVTPQRHVSTIHKRAPRSW